MKHRPARPTRRQKEEIDLIRLDPADWLVCCESEHTITLYNKYTGKTVTKVKKERKKI